MIAAVLAMLASVQLAAATETVRQTGAAGSPVRGSRMWWSTSPPRRQRRAAVLEVARPPPWMATTADGPACASSGRPLMSCTRIRQPPAGGWPLTAMSPPRLTSTPQPSAPAMRAAERSAAQALAVAPRSSRTPGGTRSSRACSSNSTWRQPGMVRMVSLTAGPSRWTSEKSRS